MLLRESFTTPVNYRYQVVNKPIIETKIDEDLKQFWTDKKLQESFKDKQLYEKISKRLFESSNWGGKTYRFPIARYDIENNNHRIYPRKLFENVVNYQRDSWGGLCGLADHPEGDDNGQWKYSCIVWLDMEVGDDGIVYAIGRPVGPYGSLLTDIVDANGRVGFSSSGFGDVDPLTKIVDPDTYKIDRTADVVLNPSQNVYGTVSNESTPPVNYANGSTMNENTEPKSMIVKSKNIGENKMTVDATKVAQDQGAALQEATAPVAAVSPQQTSLSKAEEKAFRKYVESFVNETSDIKNPADRLKEMAEILSMFNEGVAPDLREKLEEKLVTEQTALEQLVESAIKINETFGTDSLEHLEEGAKKIASQGILLSENVDDYKIIVEGLTSRNKKLLKENAILAMKLKLRESRVEKTTLDRNRIKVGSDTQIGALLDEMDDIKKANLKLQETNKKLSKGNIKLERDTGLLNTQLAEQKIALAKFRIETTKNLKESNGSKSEITSLKETIATYEAMIARLQEKNKKLTAEKTDMSAEFEAYKQRILEESDVSRHIQPKYAERVQGMLNFRENNGIEVEQYWQDQCKRYGESILPFEKQIRGAKTLREATNAFIRNRNLIDSDFGQADSARITEGFMPVAMRKQVLQEAGMSMEDSRDLESVNSEFLERARKMGLR